MLLGSGAFGTSSGYGSGAPMNRISALLRAAPASLSLPPREDAVSLWRLQPARGRSPEHDHAAKLILDLQAPET